MNYSSYNWLQEASAKPSSFCLIQAEWNGEKNCFTKTDF